MIWDYLKFKKLFNVVQNIFNSTHSFFIKYIFYVALKDPWHIYGSFIAIYAA